MIKNIIFDFGAVLIPIDENKTRDAFNELGANEEFENQKETFEKFEKGEISREEFLSDIQPYFFRKIFPPQLAEAWNAMLGDLPAERKYFLKKLKKDYRIFLLSNTNELHMQQVLENTGNELFNRFKNQFEGFYLSHEIGFRKPDHEIYQFVLREHTLNASETLFVDDLNENTTAAAALGFHTWNLKPGAEEVTELFNKNLPL